MEGGDLSFDGDPITSEQGEQLELDVPNLETRCDITYEYDPLGQLTRVNDEGDQATWTYAYDQGGNILEKRRYAYTLDVNLSSLTPEETIPYVYADANWKDKLTAYDGKAIVYDAIGNPLAYDGWTYTWKAGRMLYSMSNAGTTAEFTYDHTGLRVKKSVSGVDTLYTMNGKRITHMRKGANDVNDPNYVNGPNATRMHFFYDGQGRATMIRYNGEDYAYLHNLQGDVTGMMDMTGELVVQYRYDAWGRSIVTEGSLAGTLGVDNPFRYRGYVWDEETGLFYTPTRYYNPEWGRWLSADTLLGRIGALLSQNSYAYCANNPVNMVDSTGLEAVPQWPQWAQGIPFRYAGDFTYLIEERCEGYVGYIKTDARIRLPDGVVIEGHIRQTPKAYHFDFYPDDKDEYRSAVDALGDPYNGRKYYQGKEKTGVPIQFEVDYPDGTMITWASVYNQDKEDEVCVWIIDSQETTKGTIGMHNEHVKNAPVAFKKPSTQVTVRTRSLPYYATRRISPQ